jgi:hypothetical protein
LLPSGHTVPMPVTTTRDSAVFRREDMLK